MCLIRCLTNVNYIAEVSRIPRKIPTFRLAGLYLNHVVNILIRKFSSNSAFRRTWQRQLGISIMKNAAEENFNYPTPFELLNGQEYIFFDETRMLMLNWHYYLS